jgi:hypothetical protein
MIMKYVIMIRILVLDNKYESKGIDIGLILFSLYYK